MAQSMLPLDCRRVFRVLRLVLVLCLLCVLPTPAPRCLSDDDGSLSPAPAPRCPSDDDDDYSRAPGAARSASGA